MSETTHIVDRECDLDIHQCDNCGAYAPKAENIKHHATCTPGEAKKWEKFYEEANAEEEQYNKEEEI